MNEESEPIKQIEVGKEFAINGIHFALYGDRNTVLVLAGDNKFFLPIRDMIAGLQFLQQ